MPDRQAKPLPRLTEAQLRRFLSYFTKGATDECWIWNGLRLRPGYGIFGIGRNNPYKAHRIAYFLHYGVDPWPKFVCHRCDNPSCVNPKHLFVGTSLSNNKDRLAKGGYARGEDHFYRKHPDRITRGEDHPNFKLTNENVLCLRRISKQLGIPAKFAGLLFGVSKNTVRDIVSGRSWKHLPI